MWLDPDGIRICLLRRGPYRLPSDGVLTINKSGVLDLPTPQDLARLYPDVPVSWVDRVQTSTQGGFEFMYAFKSNSNFPPAGQPLQWELIDGLSGRTLATALRTCLEDYLDFEYCVPIIMNARGEVLFLQNIDGSLHIPMGCQKPWWPPGAAAVSAENLLATTREPALGHNELWGHVSFYNPAPGFDLAIRLGVSWASKNPVWLKPDHGLYLNQDDKWPALYQLPSLLKRLVLDRPEVLARVRRFGAPLANVFDLL